MKIINSIGNSFNILRINLTFIEPKDTTILMHENQTNYFYLEKYYFQESDVLIFSSYGIEIIKYYLISYSEIYESNKKYGLLFFDDNDIHDYILEISTKRNESILINMKFLPKNMYLYNSEDEQTHRIKQIQLSIENSGYHEIYYLKNQKYYSYFLRGITGKFESSYVYLEDLNNLDDAFLEQNNKMISFNDNIIYREDIKMVLMHFKSINNNPVIFELISMYYYISHGIIEGSFILSKREN